MSSRALRRLQGSSGLELSGSDAQIEIEEDGSEEDDSQVIAGINQRRKKQKKKKGNDKRNLFDVLGDSSVKSEEEDIEHSEGTEDVENASDKEDKSVNAAVKSKKKKKKKRKGKETADDADKGPPEPTDEIEASLLEVNRLLGDPGTVSTEADRKLSSATIPLLQIDYRHLNPENELKRIFGADVVRGERPSHRGRRKPPSVRRSFKLVQPRETWHPTTGTGLSMVHLGGDEGFSYVHSSVYQDVQYEHYAAVQSANPENIFNILRKHSYHIDTLIQMAEFYRMNEDSQTAAECIEKALFGLESAFAVMFNLASGNCILQYRRQENRALHICIFKHILNVGRRGCYRTAFEFCKLLLGLDRKVDPLNIMYLIDFYAIRSSQYDFLIRLWKNTKDNPGSVLERVNFALSVPLALFHTACSKIEDTKEADELLQDRLLMYPLVLKPLLDKCSVQPDKRVDKHAFFNSNEMHNERGELPRVVKMVVERCYPCWKEVEVMAWLERNVQIVLDIVDKGKDPRIDLYATKRETRFKGASQPLLRHYVLCEISNLGLPRSVQNMDPSNLSVTDPFPPRDTITVYSPDRRRPNAPAGRGNEERNRNVLGLLLQSLLPTYDQNAPPEVNNREEEEVEGARAIPHQIHQNINAIMDAMRALLTDIRGPEDMAAADHGAVLDPDNEQDWEDEEEDFHQRR